MRRKIQFAQHHFYHIYNRGVDKRKIFLDDVDYLRFLQGLKDFNDIKIIGSIYLKKTREKINFRSLAPKVFRSEAPKNPKEPLVKILCYCLMSNHFHLLLEPLTENGISGFMQRLGTGYANYFNLRYERTGGLFEGPFRAVLVERDSQLMHLLRYIHLNVLNLLESNWREEGIKDWEMAEEFLKNYRWSSHPVYLSESDSQIIDKGIFSELFSDRKSYQDFLKDWAVKDLPSLNGLSLE